MNSSEITTSLRSEKGFTLVELLLYVSLSAIILFITSTLVITIVQGRIKNQTIAEVEQQGMQVMHRITQTLRNADGITMPSAGNSGNQVILTGVAGSGSPVGFDEDNGVMRMIDSAIFSLTNSSVTASGTSFQNISRVGTPGTIRVTFTLTHVNPEGRNEFSFAKTFTGSASLRAY